ncbi:MAG: class I SAM-dependent methyltransferase [Rhodocyclaceae bacterium]|nr:class I SAM-dependent methyltransferase [Rhodocyclaceae bacterium]MBX3667145.1 class I SAM-dependent methyltransferase [Rhodocyclaceae bacterium]
MDPIAKTAYYCCGVRMLDAHEKSPVCGDHYAELFMDADARAVFQRFESFRGPNAANAARHRIIDDILRERIAARPNQPILLLGAGFDTRAFRLGGGDWFEIDTPAIVAHKEHILPARSAPNKLTRMGMDFGQEKLEPKLETLAAQGNPVVVVMEGVSMYLTPEQLRATLATLVGSLPGHTLVCDLMSAAFARRYGWRMRQRIRELGGNFAPLLDEPADFVIAQGYRERGRHSISGRAVEHGSVPLPRWLFNSLLKSLRDGYQLYVFESLPE